MTATISATPNPVQAGQPVTVTYTGGPPNATIQLDVFDSNGGNIGAISITLDGNGEGSSPWTAPTNGQPFVTIEDPTGQAPDYALDIT